MKATLVNVRTMTRNAPPLGLLYVAAALEQDGHEVEVIDPRPSVDEDFDYVEQILRTQPDVVGFTLVSNQVRKAVPILKAIKSKAPGVTLVAGGPHPTFMYERMLQSGVDVVVIGEGELTARDLVNAIRQGRDLATVNGIAFTDGKGDVVVTPRRDPIEDLDSIPIPARHLVDMDFYSKRNVNIRGLYLRTASIMTSRGCPGRCTFCASPGMWNGRVRYRDPRKVVDEMERLHREYRLDGFVLLDDTFALNRRHVSEICAEMRRRRLDVTWNCQGRVNTTTEEMVETLVGAGCAQIEFGCESGSQRVLDLSRKGVTVAQIEDAFRICRKSGVRRFANFVVGFPTETREDIELTRQLARRIEADHCEFYVLTPYPGTEIQAMAMKDGYEPDFENVLWEHGHRGQAQAYWESGLSRAEVIRIRDELQKEFRSKFVWRYAANPYVIADFLKETFKRGFYRDLRRVRSSEDLVYFIVDRITR